jgi:hypothetical protein
MATLPSINRLFYPEHCIISLLMIQVKWPTDVSSVGLSPFSISGMSPPRRVAIVTGAASGIGKAIALKLASDGLNVALNDLPDSLDKLSDVAALASQYGIDTILVPGDVSSEAEVEKMVHDTVNRFGGLDVVGSSCCQCLLIIK